MEEEGAVKREESGVEEDESVRKMGDESRAKQRRDARK